MKVDCKIHVIQGRTNDKNRRRIAVHFGAQHIVDDWRGSLAPGYYESGSVLFTESERLIKECTRHPSIVVWQLDRLVKEINDAIPLTDWIEGKPTLVGEYIASIDHYSIPEIKVRRHWDGKCWSVAWDPSAKYRAGDEHFKRAADSTFQNRIRYRGLSQEPIILE